MERIKEIIELFTKENGILSHLSYIPFAIMSLGVGNTKRLETEFMGDNAPYTLIDKIKEAR